MMNAATLSVAAYFFVKLRGLVSSYALHSIKLLCAASYPLKQCHEQRLHELAFWLVSMSLLGLVKRLLQADQP